MHDIVPIFSSPIQGEAVQCCNARDLHAFLDVGRNFSNWIKGRIEQYGFIEGEDYIVAQNLTTPDPARSKSRQRNVIDYYLTLGMAKELAMVENNETGRKVRRYFIQAEKQTRELLQQRANRNLPIEQVRARLKDTPSLKTLFVLQKQAIETARKLGDANNQEERQATYNILCYIYDAMGMPVPEEIVKQQEAYARHYLPKETVN